MWLPQFVSSGYHSDFDSYKTYFETCVIHAKKMWKKRRQFHSWEHLWRIKVSSYVLIFLKKEEFSNILQVAIIENFYIKSKWQWENGGLEMVSNFLFLLSSCTSTKLYSRKIIYKNEHFFSWIQLGIKVWCPIKIIFFLLNMKKIYRKTEKSNF